MKKILSLALVVLLGCFLVSPSFTHNTAIRGKITAKTVCFGLASLLIWPGIGQYLNHNETKKNLTHAVVGVIPPFRLWSGWDAMTGRQGGLWNGKI